MSQDPLEIDDWIRIYNTILIAEVPFEVVQTDINTYELRFFNTMNKCYLVFELEPQQ